MRQGIESVCIWKSRCDVRGVWDVSVTGYGSVGVGVGPRHWLALVRRLHATTHATLCPLQQRGRVQRDGQAAGPHFVCKRQGVMLCVRPDRVRKDLHYEPATGAHGRRCCWLIKWEVSWRAA
eukprot:352555-Chlamydomonas_euryale.AAC.1